MSAGATCSRDGCCDRLPPAWDRYCFPGEWTQDWGAEPAMYKYSFWWLMAPRGKNRLRRIRLIRRRLLRSGGYLRSDCGGYLD